VLVAWLGGMISEYDAAKQHSVPTIERAGSETRVAFATSTAGDGAARETEYSAVEPSGSSGIAFAASLTPGLDRLEAFHKVVQGIDASNWQEVAEATKRAQTEGLIANMEESWIYQRIGEVAGPVAMKFFEPEDLQGMDLPRGGLSTLRGWAAKDPEAAWAYLESLPEANFRWVTTGGFIRTAVEKDLTLARRALDSMGPAAQADFLSRELRGDVPGAYTRLAEEWLKESTPTDPAKASSVQSAVFANLVQLRMAKGREYAGSEEMAEWLATYAGKPYALSGPIRWAVRAQSKRDPARALSLVETLIPPDQPVSSQVSWNVVADSVAMFIASDPEAGLRWITERRDSPYYGPAVYALIAEQGTTMNEEAIQQWVQTVDPQTKQRINEWRQTQKTVKPGTDSSISGQIRGK
jgi:hypothetical protein